MGPHMLAGCEHLPFFAASWSFFASQFILCLLALFFSIFLNVFAGIAADVVAKFARYGFISRDNTM